MYRFHGGKSPKGALDFSVPTNPLGPPRLLVEILEDVVKNDIDIILSYPDYEYEDLRKAIAKFYDIDYKRVIPLNGSAEALYIALAVCKPRNLVVVEPTFGDYRAASHVLGIPLRSIHYIENADIFEFPLESLFSLPNEVAKGSLILLSNPNNPTGSFVELKRLEEIARTFKESFILIDEAFIELSEMFLESSIHLVEEYGNVIVTRSLTKSFSVPGLRIGFMYSSYELSRAFDLYRQPWNVNSLTNHLFVKLLDKFEGEMKRFLETSRRFIHNEKVRVTSRLRKLKLLVYRSYAPFLLVKSIRIPASKIIDELMKYNIYVRDASSYVPLTKHFFRIAIKKEEENDYLVNVLSKMLGGTDEHNKEG